MLNYEEFKAEIMENIKDHLSEEYQDYGMKVNQITKSNGIQYEGLTIAPEGNNPTVAPTLNLTAAFSEYEAGKSMEEILDTLANIRMENNNIPGNFNKEDLFEFDKCKDKINPRIINTETNAEYLTDKPHVDFEDLSILYAVRVFENSDGFGEAVITNDLMEMWGVSVQDIHDKAMDNLSEKEPLISTLEGMLFGGDSLDINELSAVETSMPFFVLTNQQKTKGSVMAICPEVMDKITEQLGDVYILPSSVDEVILVPVGDAADIKSLADMVRNINANEVRPEDRLSDNIYHYDPKEKKLELADKFAAREAEKAEKKKDHDAR